MTDRIRTLTVVKPCCCRTCGRKLPRDSTFLRCVFCQEKSRQKRRKAKEAREAEFGPDNVGPTEAQLDAMIAEQMKHLPAWWNAAENRGLKP